MPEDTSVLPPEHTPCPLHISVCACFVVLSVGHEHVDCIQYDCHDNMSSNACAAWSALVFVDFVVHVIGLLPDSALLGEFPR